MSWCRNNLLELELVLTISVFVLGTSTDNPFNSNAFDECIKNNKENDGHETYFNLYSTSAKYLF